MKGFSIYSFITEVRKDNWDMTPNELTKLVLKELPAEREGEALQQCLRKVVSDHISSSRDGRRPYLHPVPNRPEPPRDSAKSWKTSASRRRWETYLEDPFHVVPGSPDYIRFGDCRVDDLIQAVQKRHDAAEALRVTAAVLEEWCQLLVKHGARRIRELPESVLRERLNRGAAA